MAEPTRSARGQLLQTAARLFYQHGYRAIGVDTIVAESGVGKMTLYRHFPSKDDLVVAYLQDSNDKFWAWFNEATSSHPDSPRQQLAALFEALTKLVAKPTCYGCPFLTAATEFPEHAHPGHKVALEHKQAVRVRLSELARQAGAAAPDVLADQLLLLMDGAFIQARMFGAKSPAVQVVQAATALIDAQLK